MSHPERLSVEITRRVDEGDVSAWETLSTGKPFAGPRWMRFGETVMADCESFHVHLRLDGRLVSSGTFWQVAAEPLPLPPFARTPVSAFLRARPLLICRSPLANWTGLVLPDETLSRSAAREIFLQTGLRLLEETRGSYLLFDFLEPPNLEWPAGVTVTEVSDPSTRLDIRWSSFDAFLSDSDKRGRQHYKRVQREAEALYLEHSLHASIANVDEALPLIRAVEKKFHAAPNPWMRPLLENAAMVGGVWQEVRQNDRLVGCGLLLEDNGVMFATALGLVEDVQYAYFLLVYGALQQAILRHVKSLRLGSGAYDVKRRLGFVLEANNHTAIAAHNSVLRNIARWMA